MSSSQHIEVSTASARYVVTVGRGVSRHVAGLMREAGLRPTSCAIVCDAAVETAARMIESDLSVSGAPASVRPVHASEAAKSLGALGELCDRMLSAGLDRAGAVVAVGGGVVGDLAGFAASVYMRGVPCIQVPTTLLAMVDASVGGKTAVNLLRADGTLAKNAIGTFAQPRLVACDPDLLGTLPVRELRSGLAECIKHAVISDPSQLGWIEVNADPILARDPDVLAELVARNVRIKAAVVSADEREEGGRAVLNLGHTFAHAIESLAHTEVTHGEAVAIGTLAACRLGLLVAGCSPDVEFAVRRATRRVGLPCAVPGTPGTDRLMAAMAADKKRRGGVPRLVVPHALGDVRVHEGIAESSVRAAWAAVGAD